MLSQRRQKAAEREAPVETVLKSMDLFKA